MLIRAFNNLICIFANPTAIFNSSSDLQNACVHSQKTKHTNFENINDAGHECGNVQDEIDKVTIFVNKLSSSI